MTFADTAADRFLPADPILDRRGRPVPDGIALVLGLLRILLTYGRPLAAALDSRATRRSFSVIAVLFGTSGLSYKRVSPLFAEVTKTKLWEHNGHLYTTSHYAGTEPVAAAPATARLWPGGPLMAAFSPEGVS